MPLLPAAEGMNPQHNLNVRAARIPGILIHWPANCPSSSALPAAADDQGQHGHPAVIVVSWNGAHLLPPYEAPCLLAKGNVGSLLFLASPLLR